MDENQWSFIREVVSASSNRFYFFRKGFKWCGVKCRIWMSLVGYLNSNISSGWLDLWESFLAKLDWWFNCCCSVTKSCLIPCNSLDCSMPGSSVLEVLQARILEWVAICFSRGSSWPRDWTGVSCITGRFFTVWATSGAQCLLECAQIHIHWVDDLITVWDLVSLTVNFLLTFVE